METDGALLHHKIYDTPCLRLIGIEPKHFERDPFLDFGVFEARTVNANRVSDGYVRGIANSLQSILGIADILSSGFMERFGKLAAQFVDLSCQ